MRCLAFGFLDQRQVTGVQRAHGRDHSDLFAGLVPVRDAVAQRFYGVNDGGFLGHGRYSADLFLRRARGRGRRVEDFTSSMTKYE